MTRKIEDQGTHVAVINGAQTEAYFLYTKNSKEDLMRRAQEFIRREEDEDSRRTRHTTNESSSTQRTLKEYKIVTVLGDVEATISLDPSWNTHHVLTLLREKVPHIENAFNNFDTVILDSWPSDVYAILIEGLRELTLIASSTDASQA